MRKPSISIFASDPRLDAFLFSIDNELHDNLGKNLLSPKLLAELESVMADVARGKRDPEAMRKAAREMDKMREETRNELRTLDIAVELIREGRDEN